MTEELMDCATYTLIKDRFYLPVTPQNGPALYTGDLRILEVRGSSAYMVKLIDGDARPPMSVFEDIRRNTDFIYDCRSNRRRTFSTQYIILCGYSYYAEYINMIKSYEEQLVKDDIQIHLNVICTESTEICSVGKHFKEFERNLNSIVAAFNLLKSNNMGAVGREDIEVLLRSINTDKEKYSKPLKGITVTKVIIGINVLCWIIGIISEQLYGVDYLKQYGIQNGILIRYFNQYWRLVTPIFLHAGFLHMAMNSYFLYYLGETVERYYGKARFIILYLFTGIVGNIVSFFTLNPFSNSLGASGACLGVGGALVYIWLRKEDNFFKYNHSMSSLVLMILFNVFYGFFIKGANIDNGAHVGGFLAGMLFAFIYSIIKKIKLSKSN